MNGARYLRAPTSLVGVDFPTW